MKVFVNARFLTQKITGAQRFAIEISKRIKKKRPDITFISPHNIIHKNIAKELDAIIVGKNTGYLWEQIDLPMFLRKAGNPLLINLVNMAPIFYKNKITAIHDISWFHFPESVSKPFLLWYKFTIPKIAKSSKFILTVSHFSKEDLVKNLGIERNKIDVVYNAVSDFFHPTTEKKEKIILSVATLQPYKNMESLIKAFIHMKKKHKELKDYKLLLVGGINSQVFQKTKIPNIVGKRNDVIFTGYVSDKELRDLYSKAEVFVLVSKFEGFGIPPLEAMSCGTPVVVSNVASLPEVCGDAAVYVDPYNVENIAEGIYSLLKNKELQNELIEMGFKRVKNFSWEKTSDKVLHLLERFF